MGSLIKEIMACQAKVKEGVLQGKECITFYGKKYYSFEGIPYAKPPIGRLRFSNPVVPDSWRGIRDATKPGNKCIQLNPYSNTPLEGDEDCLYLNVYTPSLPQKKIEKLPVIFFVHGGRFIVGYGDYYEPDYLIRHDVILVTINYRLHILGFLCLNIPEAPGNIGLKDTVMALRWVNNNIACFNGDPKNITVFGESAGAALVTSYITSKMAEGLYSKVIAQSGNLLSDLYLIDEDPIEKAKHVASLLGQQLTNEKSLYKFLLEAPIKDLIHAFSLAELSRAPSVINAYFLPVVEKKFEGVERFFDEYPIVTIRENRFQKVPVLTGLNSHEAALFLRLDDDGNIIYEEDFYYFVPRFSFLKKNTPKAANFEKKLRAFYFSNKTLDDNLKREYVEMISDIYFTRDIMYFAEILSKLSTNVFFFKFIYSGGMNTRVMKNLGMKGSSHGDIIQYQFYRKSKASKSTDKDQKIIDFLSEAWCNFAKSGKPTWTNQKIEWLPYTKDKKCTLVIDEELKLETNLDHEKLRFWMSITGDRSKL